MLCFPELAGLPIYVCTKLRVRLSLFSRWHIGVLLWYTRLGLHWNRAYLVDSHRQGTLNTNEVSLSNSFESQELEYEGPEHPNCYRGLHRMFRFARPDAG